MQEKRELITMQNINFSLFAPWLGLLCNAYCIINCSILDNLHSFKSICPCREIFSWPMSSAQLPIQAQGADGEEEVKFTILFAAQHDWFTRFFF